MSAGGGGFYWVVQGFVQSFQADIVHLSRLDYGRFLPYPFQFFNRQSFYHSPTSGVHFTAVAVDNVTGTFLLKHQQHNLGVA
jgi:hypothetical protein